MLRKLTPGGWVVMQASSGQLSIGAQHAPDCWPKTRMVDQVTATKDDVLVMACSKTLLHELADLVNRVEQENLAMSLYGGGICVTKAKQAVANALGADGPRVTS